MSKYKDFSHIKVGQWVKLIAEPKSDTTLDKYYQRILFTGESARHYVDNFCFFCDDGIEGNNYPEESYRWDLENVLDYNPEDLRVGDEVVIINSCSAGTANNSYLNDNGIFVIYYDLKLAMKVNGFFEFKEIKPIKKEPQMEKVKTQEITKGNIEEVLKYNVIKNFEIRARGNTGQGITLYSPNKQGGYGITIPFLSPNWLALIETELRMKLKPLPAFDFKQYLLDNGFINTEHLTYKIDEANDCFTLEGKWRNRIKLTRENCDILIAMAKLAEELK